MHTLEHAIYSLDCCVSAKGEVTESSGTCLTNTSCTFEMGTYCGFDDGSDGSNTNSWLNGNYARGITRRQGSGIVLIAVVRCCKPTVVVGINVAHPLGQAARHTPQSRRHCVAEINLFSTP